jgi:hypothetical protein
MLTPYISDHHLLIQREKPIQFLEITGLELPEFQKLTIMVPLLMEEEL